MSGGGWTADPSSFILPPGATPPDTFIFFGPAEDDPSGALTIAGLDAGMVFYFGSAPYAFVLGIFQEVGFNDGHLYLAGVDPLQPSGSRLNRLLETDWQPVSAGGSANQLILTNPQQTLSLNPISFDLSVATYDCKITAGGIIHLGDESTTGIPQTINADGELLVQGNDIGRGVVASTGTTAASAAIGTTETTVLTLPNTTYKANRAYRCYLHAGLAANTAGALGFSRLVKGGVGGQALGEFSRWALTTTGNVYGQHGFIEFACGPADVTTNLAITLQASTGTVTQSAGAGYPRTCTIEDIGTSAQISSAVIDLV